MGDRGKGGKGERRFVAHLLEDLLGLELGLVGDLLHLGDGELADAALVVEHAREVVALVLCSTQGDQSEQGHSDKKEFAHGWGK